MQYTLMHKRLPVGELEMDESSGAVAKVREIYRPEHLPLGGPADRGWLNQWWSGRTLPLDRAGVREALAALGVAGPRLLALGSWGLSLSDHYWLRPQGCGLAWEEVSFFRRPFSGDVGDALLGRPGRGGKPELRSPDAATDGFLPKRWVVLEGKPHLMKGGSPPYFQQPFNEVLASELLKRLGVPHVPYTLCWQGGQPYSLCPCLVAEDTELVTAWQVMGTGKKDNRTSLYQHFLARCEALGAGDLTARLDEMLVLDYLIADEDRHFSNFALLRDPETLAWKGMAPLFDSGTSMGYDRTAERMAVERDLVCKPFKRRQLQQLELVTSYDWIDFDALADGEALVYEICSGAPAAELLGTDRISAMASALRRRTAVLRHRAAEGGGGREACSVRGDVTDHRAETYRR